MSLNIELSSLELDILEYIRINIYDIAEEIKLSKKGTYNTIKQKDKDGSYYNIEIKNYDDRIYISDLSIFLFNDYYVKINFRNYFYSLYIENIDFYIGDIKILTLDIKKMSKDGDKLYTLLDPYKRENSIHDLKKGWRFFINKINNEFYQPYLRKIKNQKLYKDILLDKYLREINNIKTH